MLILLEEPDATIHVGAMPALRDLLISLAKRSTVVATSQSPAFVGLLDPAKHVTALDRAEGTTRASSLAEALSSRRWLESFAGAEAFFRFGSERRR
jgi:predicted ATPase